MDTAVSAMARRACTAFSLALILVLTVEAASTLFFFFDRGTIFHLRDKTADGGVPAAFHVADAVFQPYAGYVLRPGREGAFGGAGWRANNSGFQYVAEDGEPYCCDVPYERRDDEVLVGIFGGSVGTGFALDAQKEDHFAHVLRTARPDWRGRTVRVLNFALPGYRQPQQVTVLAHFLAMGQAFDLIINIDGFNEAVTGFSNWRAGAPVSYPADQLWGAWGRQLEQYDVPVGETGYLLATYHRILGRQAEERSRACPLAACYYGFRAIAAYHGWRRAANEPDALDSLTARSYFPTRDILPGPSRENLYETIATLWASGSRQMAALSSAHGSRYLHILQPNQWYTPAGPYAPIAADHAYEWVIVPVNQGYDAFRARIPDLQAAGVRVLDFSTLFKGRDPRALYSDDCCHYTAEGNARIVDTLGDAMAAD